MSQTQSFPKIGTYLVLITAVAGVIALVFFTQKNNLSNIKLADNQDQLLPQLHQIMELPDSEPQVVTIQETATLTNAYPEIANDARPGMIIISYPNQTILYDPATRKIVKSVSYFLPQPLKISIRYSPGEEKRAKQFAEEFSQASPLYKIVETTSSAQIYKGDIAVINNEQRTEEIKILNQLIGNGPLLAKNEASEAASTADIFIIFGKPGYQSSQTK